MRWLLAAASLCLITAPAFAAKGVPQNDGPPPPIPPGVVGWAEVGDAGQLPGTAQTPTCTGSLDMITGTIGGTDADMYLISIVDPAGFEAKTWPGTPYDTQLCLFRQNGTGVTFNDDDAAGGGGLNSRITGTVCQFPAGCYYLAVTSYDYDADSAGGAIWQDTPFGSERCPDGPGAAGAITGWSGTSFNTGGYQIDLRGTSCCGGATPVEPSTWGTLKGLYR